VRAGGDDATVRIWDLKTQAQISLSKRSDKVRSCAYRPDGAHLAVGLYSGHVEVLEVDVEERTGRILDRPPVATLTQPTRWIEEMKFSFEGSVLAVGSHDRSIYIYDARGEAGRAPYGLVAKCTRHSSYITHIDFGVMVRRPEDVGRVYVDKTGQLYNPQT
jgi:lipoxygenase homology domain-containing protein 1